MAFNPFSSFRKYQKFWLAGTILLSMVTFVLCTGVGSHGLEDWLMMILGRQRGPVIAKINGKSIYRDDLSQLEQQRKIANDFMREATKILVSKIDQALERIDTVKDKKLRTQEEQRLKTIRQMFQERLKEKQFFGTGTDLQELLNFIIWRDQADRLGVVLVTASVQDQLDRLLLNPILRKGLSGGFGAEEAYEAQRRLQDSHSRAAASYDQILAALREEFRVEIAKLSLEGARTAALLGENPFQFSMQTRLALTPHQLWQQYQEDLTEFDVALIPVKVEAFVSKAKEPDDIALKGLFQKYRTEKYNPASDTPGFADPEQVKVTWMTADPSDPHYSELAKVVTTLEKYPPIFWDSGLPGLGTILRLAVGESAWDASMQRNYEQRKENFNTASQYYLGYATDAHFRLPLYTKVNHPDAGMVARLVAGNASAVFLPTATPGFLPAGFASYQTAAYAAGGKREEAAIAQETKERTALFTSMVLSATPMPLTALGMYAEAERTPQFLPFPVVEPEMRQLAENKRAAEWAKAQMNEARAYLEKARGEAGEMEARLRVLQQKMPGLQIHSTTQYRSQYDIDQDPNVAGFLDSYQKFFEQINYLTGWQGTEKALKSDDFSRLFFGSDDPFSIANAGTYAPQEWPPTVTLPARPLLPNEALHNLPGMEDIKKGGQKLSMWSLFADKPILFWKTAYQRATQPTALDQVRSEVKQAWKFQEARDLAFNQARDIARQLEQRRTAKQNMQQALALEAGKLGENIIILPHVARKQRVNRGQFGLDYIAYQLPKDLIPYPRPDMAQQILALNDLRKPLQTSVVTGDASKKDEDQPGTDPKLDTLNKQLFQKDLVDTGEKQIQVLTNRPRSVYYVAVVTKVYPPTLFDFQLAYQMARGQQQAADYFVTQAREEAAAKHRERLIEQLRSEANYEPVDLSAYKQ